MHSSSRRLFSAALVCAVVLIGILGGAATALAATSTGPATFSARTPADGSSVGVVRPPISVKAYDVKGLAGSPYYSIKVDGVLQTATFARTDANNITLSFTPRADMANGTHTVYVSVKNNSGVYSTTTWSFTVSKAPLPSAPAPVPGSTVSVTNPTISVTVGGATTGLSSTVLVDGVAVPATFNPTTGVLSAPTSGLANDASHDVTVTVTNSSGISAALSWSFSVQVYAPMPTPASGCVSCHPGFPESHPMDNCPACHGPDSPVGEGWNVPQYGPHSASYVAQSENSCVACHTSGYSSVPPLHSMTSGTTSHNSAGACSPCHVKSLTTEHYRYGKDCFTCHASANPLVAAAISTGRTDCEACHPGAAAHVAVHQTTVDASCAGAGCHSGSALTSVHTGTCDSCHKSTDPRVVAAIAGHVKSCDACHSTQSHEAQHATEIAAGCAGSGCHSGTSLTTIHINDDTSLDCDSCHASGDSAVISAIANHQRDCAACHDVDHNAAHDTDIGDVPLDGSPFVCTDCHDANMVVEHGKPTSSSEAASCAACHPALRATITTFDRRSCVQGDCHTPASTKPMHASIASSHAIPSDKAACLASGCHDVSASTPFADKTVAEIHSAASTTTASGTRSGCKICHFPGVTLTANCTSAGCHPEKSDPHGYPPERHVVNESCIQSCHQPLQGLTELKPVHDALATPVGCSGCHATKVAAIAPWDKTCTACHPISEIHTSAAQDHVGTDEAYQDASFFGNGCSDSSGHTGQSNCHDISSISALHSKMGGNGCVVCHGDGTTAAQECLDCHKPGYATEYTRPGAASASLFATSYPNSDNALTPGWTYTTTPAAQPIYNVVNTPYPPADTTRYVTITSTTAGGVLFGFGATALPDNARITDVRIYAKARAANNTTYARKMQGALKIGGQTYLSALPSTSIPLSFPAGAGTSFGTTSTRVDFTREPLYGESIWLNPKTGLDWTPAEFNGTDPDSSLQAFGVNLTSSSAANNVSLSQIYLKVTYYTVGPSETFPTVGTHTYHGNNVKYLHDPSDVPAGQRFADNPAHGWYEALYYQDCYDFCHRGNYGDPTFSATQGSWMWYSVGGDPYDAIAATRTLALKTIAVPTDSPTLTFTTNYQLGTGAAGYVEISTNGGGTWTPLTGSVGGVSKSSLTGNASGWVSASYDLSTYAGQSAKLRFRYVNGSSMSAGWAFDSLAIGGSGGPVFSDDAETLKPDWTNTYWTRAKGAFPY